MHWLNIFILYIFSTCIIVIFGLYLWFWKIFEYWKTKKIYSPKPNFPFGNCGDLLKGNIHISEQFQKLYMQYKKEPLVGIYLGYKPILLVNDLDCIKNMLIKDFMNFTDHGLVHNEMHEPLEGHLFNINGNRWKNLRIKILQSFTSGKMKIMYDNLVRHAIEVQKYLEPHVEFGDTVDLKELFSRYGTEIMGSCLFGINSKSIGKESQVRTMSKKSQRLDYFHSFIQSLSLMAPWIVSHLRVSMYPKDVNEYFVTTAKEVYQYRKEHNVEGIDYMQSLIKLRDERIILEKSGKKINSETEDDSTMSIGDLAAQLFVFYTDGVETSSTAASFALYELARHPDIQEKVRNEIDTIIQKYNGQLTFDAFSEMKYLSQVVEETLRMYPPLPLLFRVCTRNYAVPNTDITIDKGTFLVIPVFGIHRDPDLYPDPMKFDPDRFSPENKEERHRFAHLPFGEGPRMCIGTRFGAIMTRMSVVTILTRYIITVEKKHIKPFTFEPNSFIIVPKEGINLKLSLRKDPLNLKSLNNSMSFC